ncbi:uncharacterized protein LOC127871619 isoform X3 [Dreissena polymorpha]|uniref:Uncharacterized protein n=2 Tax=Dreissena polymorpha TaxID=45954 RepID=A0A9D4LGW2_DREPO|nr:uncharacterized protein LOC127871619 isoform X3 [Dreissena polymorpha]KAH3858425.1 hypothetical protein DPMN_101049 [Dreissena polymorpha]
MTKKRTTMNQRMLVKCIVITSLVKCLLSYHRDTYEYLLTYDTTCLDTDTCYTVSSQETTYSAAWLDCHNNGGFLAMPKTPIEMQFIRDNILGTGNHEPVWIGLTDFSKEMFFKWNDQEDLSTSTYWKLNEPHDSKGNDEDCVEIKKDGLNNARCENIANRHICQTHPQECLAGSPYMFGDRCYRLYTGAFTMNAVTCPNNGLLAMPKSKIISTYLDSINLYDNDLWIGLNYISTRGFVWADGENASSTDLAYFDQMFVGGLPYTTNISALFAYLTPSGRWDIAYEGTDIAMSFICEYRVQADCGPLVYSYGTTAAHDTKEGVTYSVTCREGFAPEVAETKCMSNGSWVPQPKCLIDCGPLVYSYGTTAANDTKKGVTYSVTCEEGFAPEFAETMCLSNGSWVPQPKCLKADGYCLDTCVNYTVDDRQLDALVQNLTLDRGNLSSMRRRMSSAEDNRFLSKCIGLSGVAIICSFCGVFVCLDLTRLLCSKSSTRVKPEDKSGVSGVAIICGFCGAFVCPDKDRLWYKSSNRMTPKGRSGVSGVSTICGYCGAFVNFDQTRVLGPKTSTRVTPHDQRE